MPKTSNAYESAALGLGPAILLPLDSRGAVDVSGNNRAVIPQGGIILGGNKPSPVSTIEGATDFDGVANYILTDYKTRRNYVKNPTAGLPDGGSVIYSQGVGSYWNDEAFGNNSIARVTTDNRPGSGDTNSVAMPISGSSQLGGGMGAGAGGASADSMPVVPGDQVFARMWWRLVSIGSGSPLDNLRVRVLFWTAAGAFISEQVVETVFGATAGGWRESVGTVTAPATAAFAALSIRWDRGAGATNVLIRVDDALLTKNVGGTVPYHDGSGYVDGSGNWITSPDSQGNKKTGWLGASHASVSDYGAFANGTTRTFTAWVYRDTNSTFDALMGADFTVATAPRLFLGQSNQDLDFQPTYLGTGDGVWAGAFPGNKIWTHLAVVFDEPGNTATLYVNGALVGVRSVTDPWALSNTNAGLMLGAMTDTHYLDGKMSYFAVNERGLSAQEIAGLYSARNGALMLTPNGFNGIDIMDSPYAYVAKDGLELPVPKYDEDYAESGDTEGGKRVRSRPTVLDARASIWVKGSSGAELWDNEGLIERVVEQIRRRKGTLMYTPQDGEPVTYDLESAFIEEAPQDALLQSQGRQKLTIGMKTLPYGRLSPFTATLSDIDTFNRDSITNHEWRFDSGVGTVVVSGGKLITTASIKEMYRPLRAVDGTGYLHFRTGATVTNYAPGVILRRLDVNNWLLLDFMAPSSAANASQLRIFKKDVGAYSTLNAGAGITINANTDYWISASAVGNVLTIKIFTTDPLGGTDPAPFSTLSATLAGADATKFGAGVKGNMGMRWDPGTGSLTDQSIEDWRFDTTTLDSFDPILNCEIIGVPGSVPALARLTASELTAVARNYLSVGLDDRYYDAANPQPTVIDSDMLVTTGWAGFPSSNSAAYDPDALGFSTVRMVGLSSNRQVICSTGPLKHKGNRRLGVRVLAAGSGPVYVRAAYRIGDGQWSRQGLNWQLVRGTQINNTVVWNDVDLGTVQIPESAPSWEARIEAYSGTTGDTLDVDFVEVMPAQRFIKATTPIDISVSSLLVAERFSQSAGNLTGQTVGGGATQLSQRIVGTGADDATVGNVAWSSPGNATAADGAMAVAAIGSGTSISHYLKGTNCGFAIPAGGTIKGIQVDVKVDAGGSNVSDNSVKLTKNGTAFVGNDYKRGQALPSSQQVVSYGGPTDLWGLTWTVAEINAASFGVGYSAFHDTSGGGGGPGGNTSVDYLRITVWYTDSAGNAWVVTNSAGTAGQTGVTVTGTQAQRTAVSDSNIDSGLWSTAGAGVYAAVGAAISVYKTDQAIGAEFFVGGLILRFVDVNNLLWAYYYQDMSGNQVKQVRVVKRIAGADSLLAATAFSGSLAGGRRIFAQVLADGSYSVWSGAPGSTQPALVLAGGDPALATGGTLASGKVGFYDAKTGATATTRNYDDLEVWTPDAIPPIMEAGGNFVIDHQSALRAGGSRPLVEGPYLKINPTDAQLAIKARRNNVDYLQDTNISDIVGVGVVLTPRVALLGPS